MALTALAWVLSCAPAARAQATADPCLRCDVMYAADCNAGLWILDLDAGTSTLVGSVGDVLFDLAVTADGRLVGVTSSGGLLLVSACDASSTPLAGGGGNALGADLFSTDLFTQGPPLVRVASDGSGVMTEVGGAVGPAAPDWCGTSSGDLAQSPTDGLLRTTLECSCPNGATALQVVDPATGLAVGDARCLRDAGGAFYDTVLGIAYESSGKLWAVQGNVAPRVLSIDPATSLVDVTAITGGFTCGFGLACLPCGTIDPCARAEPPPPGIGAALRVSEHGSPYAADITARLHWELDEAAPRPPDVHFHVVRGTDPRVLVPLTDREPLFATSYPDSTPQATRRPLVHFYKVFAADSCERESPD